MKKRSKSEKRKILASFIEYMVQDGVALDEFLFQPLDYFDWDKLEKIIELRDEMTDERIDQLLTHAEFMLDVDFVPDAEVEYMALPQPERSKMIDLYYERQKRFKELSEARKASFE